MAAPRYLTAQKIGLLILVKLYCQSALPFSATIPILSFVVANAVPASADTLARCSAPSTSPHANDRLSIEAFKGLLQGHASNIPGRTLLELYLKHLWDMNTFDSLHELFESLGPLFVLTPPMDDQDEETPGGKCLLKSSPLGAFVRRARLEFTRLQFNDAMKLWQALIKYRAPTAQWTPRLAGFAASGVDWVASEMGLSPGDSLYEVAYGYLSGPDEEESPSLDDLDRVLDFQLDRLQRFGARVPDAMKDQLQKLVRSSGTVHRQAHLVQFLDAWEAGDYTSAFDNLRRYYDYAMQSRENVQYQYALLHLAILQADFGCFGEAIAAINETIATARENQDMSCLGFSLSWLSHMAKAFPKQMKVSGYMNILGSERDTLTFLKAKARGGKMYNLLGVILLNESKLCLANGDSALRALEYMYQAYHLNIKENMNSHAHHMLLQSSLFWRLGVPHLAHVYCELLLDCYGASCHLDEHIRAIGRRAFMMSQCGFYEEAVASLQSLDPSIHRTLRYHQYITLSIDIIEFKRAIRMSDWTACSQLLTSLKPLSAKDASAPPLDPELTYLQHETYIEYLVSKGCLNEAFEMISHLARTLKEDNADVLQRVNMLVTKADLFRRAGRPELGFGVALRAASVAFRSKLMTGLLLAVGQLANILNGLEEYYSARRLLESIIPQALETGDNLLCGALYSHLGDSHVGMANPNSKALAPPPPSWPSPNPVWTPGASMLQAELYVARARECYKEAGYPAGECEQVMKLAVLAKCRGDEEQSQAWVRNHNRAWIESTKRTRGVM